MPDDAPVTIRLDQFLKRQGLAETGGQAKLLIQGGEVLLNGELETRRRRKLHPGDVVQLFDIEVTVRETDLSQPSYPEDALGDD